MRALWLEYCRVRTRGTPDSRRPCVTAIARGRPSRWRTLRRPFATICMQRPVSALQSPGPTALWAPGSVRNSRAINDSQQIQLDAQHGHVNKQHMELW